MFQKNSKKYVDVANVVLHHYVNFYRKNDKISQKDEINLSVCSWTPKS
jgi:hypothetical protein